MSTVEPWRVRLSEKREKMVRRTRYVSGHWGVYMSVVMEATAHHASVEQSQSTLDMLYVAHYPEALRFARFLARDQDTARDLAQEAFVRLAGRFVHRRVPEDFGAYYRKVIVNLHRSQLRRLRLERLFMPRTVTRREPTDPISAMAEQDRLRAALQVLGARQRAAVVLRYCLDLSESQVADSMNCSVPAAKHLVARGLDRLRQELGGEEDE